ncbi:hypothetical protein [Gemella sanguinis]|uniref:hypothetical protein n=1 Tax=Gemella sanguinis TaxID=84135 RepID=UPI0026F10A7E|nr:hypothetical protein [Gemella sanguinis]
MKIYYSKFAYTIMLVCSIIMLIALSAALYVLMFKIPNIEILPKILLSLLILFAFIFSVGFTVMTIRRLFIVSTAVEFTDSGITIYFGALNLKKLFISKEEIIKLEHITKSSNEASLPVEGIFRFTFKHDDILSGIGIFTNFDKNMRFKTLRMHLSDCKINPRIIDKLEYYCLNTYGFKFIRD